MSQNSIECICNIGLNFCIYQKCHDGRKNAGVWVNQNLGYTVITEKMLGSWLPKCNDVYDIIYQGNCYWIFCVCVLWLLRWESKNCYQYLHVSQHTHWSFVYRKVPIILSLYIQVHTDMQNWPSAVPKGLLAVAVCTILNFCSYVYGVKYSMYTRDHIVWYISGKR